LRYDGQVFVIQIFLFVLQIVLLCVLLIFIYRFVVRGISSFTDVPYVPTWYRFLAPISAALDIHPGDVVYDLGCGDARLLFYCAKRNPQAKFIGIEWNPLLVAYALVKKFILRAHNVELRRNNIFAADFSDATRIYVFLLPEVMTDIAPKLKAPHIVSRAFEVPGRKAAREFELKDAPHDAWNTFMVYVYG